MRIPHDVIRDILEMVHIKDIHTPYFYISLPQDIIKKVLSFIDFKEQFTTCSLVSNNFNTLVKMLNSEYLASIDIPSGDDDLSMDSAYDADGESTDSVSMDSAYDADGDSTDSAYTEG